MLVPVSYHVQTLTPTEQDRTDQGSMTKRKTRSSTKADQQTVENENDPIAATQEQEQPMKAPITQTQEEQQQQKQDPPTIHHFTLPFKDDKQITCERRVPTISDGSNNSTNHAPHTLIFTHGAGGGITAPSTSDFATGFSSLAPIVCYQGTMNLTNRIKYFHIVIENEKKHTQTTTSGEVVLGGRSMGARAAVLTALERREKMSEKEKIGALVLVSYPLMAGTKGEKREEERREKILKDLDEGMDVLFIVGDADAQCPMEMLEEMRGVMRARSWVCVVEGADHGMGMKPNKAAEDMRRKTGEVAARWLEERHDEARDSTISWDGESGEIVYSGWQRTCSGEQPKGKKQKL